MINSIKEFKLINLIKNTLPNKYIGDDCAFIPQLSKQLISVDTFVEDVHFSLKYFSPKDLAIKTFNAAFSDIAAMGGDASYFLLAISAKNIDFIKDFVKSLKKPLENLNVKIIGGDTTYSEKVIISITVIGKANKPIYRTGVKDSDLIYLSSYTGLSGAGLLCFQNRIDGFNILKKAHLRPSARFDISNKLKYTANAMIDISDSLLSELYHLASSSKVNIYLDNIPIHKELFRFENKVLKNHNFKFRSSSDLALYGGEDFELLYSVDKKYKNKVPGFLIGQAFKTNSKPKVYYKNKILKLTKKLYTHFN